MTKSIIDRKTEAFKRELNYDKLNDEQKRIYNAFVFRRAKPYKFSVNDAYGNTIRFNLYTTKRDDGVLHIMGKHYMGTIGSVTAKEIVGFCDVIRYGEITSNGTNIIYTLQRGRNVLRLIVALKKSKTGVNVLKSFYSNRKTSRTAGSSNN